MYESLIFLPITLLGTNFFSKVILVTWIRLIDKSLECRLLNFSISIFCYSLSIKHPFDVTLTYFNCILSYIHMLICIPCISNLGEEEGDKNPERIIFSYSYLIFLSLSFKFFFDRFLGYFLILFWYFFTLPQLLLLKFSIKCLGNFALHSEVFMSNFESLSKNIPSSDLLKYSKTYCDLD